MSDDEDYKALFFAECAELLADLQEQLALLSEGEGDAETVNAAFRAVHSVKGGAAAFGFSALIDFAHEFETVMDGLRSGRLSGAAEVWSTLTRAGDAMELLVEAAREGHEADDALIPRVLLELADLKADHPGPSQPEAAPAAPQPAPEPAPEPATAKAEARDVEITIRPTPTFAPSGHDMLRLIRGLKPLGSLEVTTEGSPPPLAALDLSGSALRWMVALTTTEPPSAITAYFSLYDLSAEIEITDPETALHAPPVTPPDTPPPPTRDFPPPEGAAPAPRPQGEAAPRPAAPSQKSLRVELSRIDRLVNLVGETVITQAALAQEVAELSGNDDLDLSHSVEAMSRQIRELQESVMAIRAQPVKAVFSRMPRVVRDLAEKLGKDARLVLLGEQTEVDTTVIEELAEPLTHMLRNSMDHGIEDPAERLAAGKPRAGTIRLAAEHRGERVVISLSDDGRGVNRERVLAKAIENGLVGAEEALSPEEIDQLIFHPGFSTAATLSDVSGRGVGMDVVKKKIQSLGGRCALRNTPGKGTLFQITLPLTLAVLDGMTVRVGEDRYILPLSTVVEALRVDDCGIERLPDGTRIIPRRGGYIRLISLATVLRTTVSDRGASEQMAIVVDTETDGHVALLVDELIGQRQVVLKSLEANFRPVEGISGATILGDGRVALIVDVPSLGVLARAPQFPPPPRTDETPMETLQ